jgi:hypothetical protein
MVVVMAARRAERKVAAAVLEDMLVTVELEVTLEVPVLLVQAGVEAVQVDVLLQTLLAAAALVFLAKVVTELPVLWEIREEVVLAVNLACSKEMMKAPVLEVVAETLVVVVGKVIKLPALDRNPKAVTA